MKEDGGLLAKIKGIKLFQNKHIRLAIIILFVCIAALIFLSTFSSKESKEQNLTNTQITSSALEYSKSVSDNLKDILSSVKGLSNVKVTVVVESSPTIKYLTVEAGDNTSVIYSKQSSSSGSPVVVAELLPKITGILIVAKGTNDLKLKNNLLNAISATYGVDIAKIDILEGK